MDWRQEDLNRKLEKLRLFDLAKECQEECERLMKLLQTTDDPAERDRLVELAKAADKRYWELRAQMG
jgi:DNA-binding ferritin-like protein